MIFRQSTGWIDDPHLIRKRARPFPEYEIDGRFRTMGKGRHKQADIFFMQLIKYCESALG
ncbi:hypothetical protein AJ87_26185 [Rhizobium yanglingense]|nr:hypothetical protein AJ87_26185 [Rhizobium yanglingense]